MKRWLYMCSLWVATFCVLLSTVVMHHHHYGEICMAIEQCSLDGNLNDEHTEHHENEQEGCQVHQMHHFLINAKVVKSIKQHIQDGHLLAMLGMNTSFDFILENGLVVSEWQEITQPLGQKAFRHNYRRGPPMLS